MPLRRRSPPGRWCWRRRWRVWRMGSVRASHAVYESEMATRVREAERVDQFFRQTLRTMADCKIWVDFETGSQQPSTVVKSFVCRAGISLRSSLFKGVAIPRPRSAEGVLRWSALTPFAILLCGSVSLKAQAITATYGYTGQPFDVAACTSSIGFSGILCPSGNITALATFSLPSSTFTGLYLYP